MSMQQQKHKLMIQAEKYGVTPRWQFGCKQNKKSLVTYGNLNFYGGTPTIGLYPCTLDKNGIAIIEFLTGSHKVLGYRIDMVEILNEYIKSLKQLKQYSASNRYNRRISWAIRTLKGV